MGEKNEVTSAVPAQARLRCLECSFDFEIPRPTAGKFEPQCPRCHSPIELDCQGCGTRYLPTRWRFHSDGRPSNAFHSRKCGAASRSRQEAREELRIRQDEECEQGLRLTAQQLADAEMDPAYEVRPPHRILDSVHCRECGKLFRGKSLANHLRRVHEMSSQEYRLRHPAAPLLSCEEWADSPRAAGRAAEWRADSLIRKYLGAEELKKCRQILGIEYELENDISELVVCRHCGGKYRDNLANSHLEQHGLTAESYRARYPNAPLRSERVNEDGRERYTRLKARAWRPEDWENWPGIKQAVGIILIENPSIENDELGRRLDESQTPFRCPESWKKDNFERAFTTPGPGAMWIRRVREGLRRF